MGNDKQNISWGRWLAEHAAGTAILGTSMAGVGTFVAISRGKPLKPEITAYAVLGTLSGLGFGRTVYTGIFGKQAQQSIPSRLENASWEKRIEQERLAGTGRQLQR